MDKKIKIIAVMVVVIVVASSLTYFSTQNGASRPTAAEKIALTSADLGPDWEYSQSNIDAPNNSQEHGLDSYVDYIIANQTDPLDLTILVYNSTADCLASFQELNSSYYQARELVNYSVVPIGDAGFLYWINGDATNPYPNVCFMKGDVLCSVWFQPRLGFLLHEPWDLDTVLSIAHLQESKIEKNME